MLGGFGRSSFRCAAQRGSGRGRPGPTAGECRRGRPRRGSVPGRATRCPRSPDIIDRVPLRSWVPRETRRSSSTPIARCAVSGRLASVTHHRGKHVVKAGMEAARLSLHEDFSFFVTDEDEGEEAGLSEQPSSTTKTIRSRSTAAPPDALLVLCSGFRLSSAVASPSISAFAPIARECFRPRRSGVPDSARPITFQAPARSSGVRSIGSSSHRRRRTFCWDRLSKPAPCRPSSMTRRRRRRRSSPNASGRPSLA